ncbi:MAG TPA: heme exporter protein CcmD [Pyrinomonadaceae bacterium]|nr:heme exporter protein CcmD [Pyrinomonadaceae bacterium]
MKSWAEFFAMGGRAFYVWGSFGVALLLMAVEVLLLLRRGRRARLRQSAEAPKMKVLKENETTT